MVDPGTVRVFCRMLHDAAARALEGAIDPGMLQLDFLHPNGGNMHSTRFPIGAVDAMADTAISAAEDGLNVYVEGRTVDVRESAGRGRTNATRGVFAFVDDSDGDKGKAGALPIAPTWSIESSPGNAHNWIVLDRAMTAAEAEPLGRALRARIGSDSATAKLTQPYRVAGTPNYPGPKKVARGRVTSPTLILSTDGPLWSAAQLADVAPPVEEPDAEASASSAGRSGATSGTFDDLIAEEGEDRSGRFFDAVRVAFRAGMLRGDVEDAMRQRPGGCAGKYLQPYDRLAEEIARAWGKVETKAEETAEAEAEGVAPTYPNRTVPVTEARAAVRDAIEGHFAAGQGVRAIKVSTGVGKTRIAAEAIAADLLRRRASDEAGGRAKRRAKKNGKAVRDKRGMLFAVPTHKLGDEVEGLFTDAGVTSRVFRGRKAPDPDMPDTGRLMCLDHDAVQLALDGGMTVSTACCKGTNPKTGTKVECSFYYECAYQAQLRAEPDVWIAAHQILFQAQAALGDVAGVVIDEGFWGPGLKMGGKGLTLDEVGAQPGAPPRHLQDAAADIAENRRRLALALRRQNEAGGVRREHLVAEGLDADFCARAYKAEWDLKPDPVMWPNMAPTARRAAARLGAAAKRVRAYAAIWDAARDLLHHESPDAVSGRLVLVDEPTDEGVVRIARTRGLSRIAQAWRENSQTGREKPTLIMDATLPSPPLLQAFYPEVEIVADVEAAAPFAPVTQILGAPTSANKLHRSTTDRNHEAVRRAILLRWIEAGRPSTLVVAQEKTEAWLKAAGMPAEIDIRHFHAVAGLDIFKAVGLVVIVGRTLPNVLAMEAEAGAVTGIQGARIAQPAKGGFFYDKVPRALRMADGTGHPIQGDQHPDPIAEAIRWQAAEAEVIQAIGRARGVNRTAADPVDIVVMNDLCLPLTVSAIMQWDDVPAGREADMATDGVALESPSDMAEIWPGAWETEKAARQWKDRVTPSQTPIKKLLYKGLGRCEARTGRPAPFRYRHPGARQKWRRGWYLPGLVGDPCAWLEGRLGATLASFEYLPDDAEGAPDEPAADDAAEPQSDGEAA